MANAVEKVNGIAIADIAKINGQDDDDLAKLNALEFTGFIAVEAHTLIATATASASSSLSFVDGASSVVFDNTYDVYEFRFMNIHPSAYGVSFGWQVNATDDAGGDYDTSLFTSSHVQVYHDESDTATSFGYKLNYDQSNDAGQELLAHGLGGNPPENDHGLSGILRIYDPSSTTYVKHFTAQTNYSYADYLQLSWITAGYINDTTAIDEIQFKMSSGNIDAGTIKMFGLAKS